MPDVLAFGAPAPEAPPVLAVLLVGVAMVTDILSVGRKRRPRPTYDSLAGYPPTQTSTRQARGSARHTRLHSIARREKRGMFLSTSGQNGYREAIFVFDCYNRRMGLPTTQTTRQASTEYQQVMKYQNGYRRDRDTR